MTLPPWLTRDYDPIGTFQRSLQMGASIAQQRAKLAEDQRQANMQNIANQQQLAANIMRAKIEQDVTAAYRKHQLDLQRMGLEADQAKAAAAAKQAADVLNETRRHNIATESAIATEARLRESGKWTAPRATSDRPGFYEQQDYLDAIRRRAEIIKQMSEPINVAPAKQQQLQQQLSTVNSEISQMRPATGKTATGHPKPSAEDIQLLMQHHDDDDKREFDKYYGEGAADLILNSL